MHDLLSSLTKYVKAANQSSIGFKRGNYVVTPVTIPTNISSIVFRDPLTNKLATAKTNPGTILDIPSTLQVFYLRGTSTDKSHGDVLSGVTTKFKKLYTSKRKKLIRESSDILVKNGLANTFVSVVCSVIAVKPQHLSMALDFHLVEIVFVPRTFKRYDYDFTKGTSALYTLSPGLLPSQP